MAELYVRARGENGHFRAYPIVRKPSSPNSLAIGNIYRKCGDDLNEEEQRLVHEFGTLANYDVLTLEDLTGKAARPCKEGYLGG